MLIDWLAAGLNPGVATLFIQSHVPEHAELHLLLSMITPLGWLERVPTYKDQQEQLKDKDLATYGFLGYPLLQSADILLYRAAYVPVGEDQVAHVEITREIARRFNHLYGREPDFEAKAERAVKSLGGRNATSYRQLRRKFQENGDTEALRARARAGAEQQPHHRRRPRAAARLSRRHRRHHPARAAGAADRDAEGAGPRRPQDVQVLRQHHRAARGAGRGRRRSCAPCRPTRRACGAPIRAIRTSARCGTCTRSIPTRRRASGWSRAAARAGIGCLDCKQPVIDKVVEEIGGMRKRAQEFEENPELVRSIVAEGAEKAREAARDTLDEVRRAMHLRAD